MKPIHTMMMLAFMVLGARATSAQTFKVTSTDGGKTVTDTVKTSLYGTRQNGGGDFLRW